MNIVTRIARRLAGNRAELAAMKTEIGRVRKELQDLTSSIQGVRRDLEILPQVVGAQRHDGKWRSIFRSQLSALLRAKYIAGRAELTTTASLRVKRFRLRSQNEEDGLILAILDSVGVARRTFVEIGSGGSGGNSAVLAHELGWAGLMVEASKHGAATARERFRHNPRVVVLHKSATFENINSLIKQAGFGGEVDLLSIDVDSTDYWLFDALDIDRIVRPRLIVTEYNAHFGPTRAVTLPNDKRPFAAPKPYFGASLAALTKVAERKGYRLLLCEENGVNAFFLRNDLARALPGVRPEEAYRQMRRRIGSDEDEPHVEDVFGLVEEHGLPLVEV